MAFHWQGNLHFCLVKDNKYSVYQNTGFLVIYVNQHTGGKGGGSHFLV